jgi:hypothetical protein
MGGESPYQWHQHSALYAKRLSTLLLDLLGVSVKPLQ